MSAVWPRPERPEFVGELAREIPFYRVRHAVKPGMAGWGLVKQGYGASKEDALVKLQYDLYYIKHQSLWLDIIILLKTVPSIALRAGIDTLTFRGHTLESLKFKARSFIFLLTEFLSQWNPCFHS